MRKRTIRSEVRSIFSNMVRNTYSGDMSSGKQRKKEREEGVKGNVLQLLEQCIRLFLYGVESTD